MNSFIKLLAIFIIFSVESVPLSKKNDVSFLKRLTQNCSGPTYVVEKTNLRIGLVRQVNETTKKQQCVQNLVNNKNRRVFKPIRLEKRHFDKFHIEKRVKRKFDQKFNAPIHNQQIIEAQQYNLPVNNEKHNEPQQYNSYNQMKNEHQQYNVYKEQNFENEEHYYFYGPDRKIHVIKKISNKHLPSNDKRGFSQRFNAPLDRQYNINNDNNGMYKRRDVEKRVKREFHQQFNAPIYNQEYIKYEQYNLPANNEKHNEPQQYNVYNQKHNEHQQHNFYKEHHFENEEHYYFYGPDRKIYVVKKISNRKLPANKRTLGQKFVSPFSRKYKSERLFIYNQDIKK